MAHEGVGSAPADPLGGTAAGHVYGGPRFHADGDLLALTYTSDGQLCSVEEPGVLRHWNASDGRASSTIALSELATVWLFGPDGRVVASASDEVELWEVATGRRLTALAQPSWVEALALATKPLRVATGHDDGVVRLWDVGSRQLLGEFGGHDRPITALAFSADGRRLASAGEDRIICVWDLERNRQLGTLSRHTDHIAALAWHPAGRSLVSAGWDRTARVWDTQTFEPVILLNSHAEQVTAAAFSPDGRILACADSAHEVHIWDAEAGRDLRVLKGHEDDVRLLAFSPDVRVLASAGVDRVIRLWDPESGQPLFGSNRAVLGHSDIGLLHNAKILVSTRGGAGLEAWDLTSGKSLAEDATNAPADVLAVSPDGQRLATAASEARIQLWDTSLRRDRTLEGQAGKVSALAFAPDSAALAAASASDGTVWLYELRNGEPALVIPVAADGCTVEALAFHPRGGLLAVGGIDWLATSGADGAVCLWNVERRHQTGRFDRGATCLAFHPSGQWLAGATLGDTICVWNADTRQLAFELSGHQGGVTAVVYSPDGRWLVSSGEDRTLRLWKASTGKPGPVHTLMTPVRALCFDSQGHCLYTGNGNTTSYRFELARLVQGARAPAETS